MAAGVVAGNAMGQDKGGVPLAPPDKQPPDLKVPTAKKQTRWAIVGLGELAVGQILPAIRQTEQCQVTALVSGHPEKAKQIAEVYGVAAKNIFSYDNYDALKDNSEVDAVYIVLPNSMHAEYTIRGLKAGKHVLCEKPMAASVEECRQMIAAAEAAQRKLMIAYRLHYEPYNMKAMEIARSGELGKVRLFEAQNSQMNHAPNIRLSKALAGGPVQDVGVYCLNAARYMTGEEPVAVSAVATYPEGDERFREVPGHVVFTLKFPSGALGMCSCGFDGQDVKRFKTIFEKGDIEMDPAFPYQNLKLTVTRGTEKTVMQLPQENHFAKEMDHFAKCMVEGKTPRTPGEEGLRDMKVVEGIVKSYGNGGEWVTLG